MPSQQKLIKTGIKYTDKLFDEISKRLEKGVKASDSLEAFLDKYHKAFPEKGNPLISLGYDKTMMDLILSETNNHRFSRPAQKELVRVTVEEKVGEMIVDVGEDIKDSVRDIVRDGYNRNLSQDEIALNISNRVSAIKGKRARAIARTEIARTATVSDYVINRERGANGWYVECRNTACPVCKDRWHKSWTPENDDSFTPSDTSAGGKGWIGDRIFSMNDTGRLPPVHPNCRCVVYYTHEEPNVKIEPVPQSTTTTTTQTNGDESMDVVDEIQVEGLETFETFVETIKKDNKKLYKQCKRHDCFEEAYDILRESQVSEFSLDEVQIIDIAQLRKDDLKEYIQWTDVDLFEEIDGFDISWKKFCEAFDLMYEFSNGRVIIDMEKVRNAVVEGINEQGYSLCYGMETPSKNKKGEKTLMLAIDF